MNNKHIELVKRWLADNDSVSPEELKENSRSADAAYDTAYAAAFDAAASDAGAYDAVASAADAFAAADAASAAYAATYADADYAYAAAKNWVKKYEEVTK